MLDPNSPTPASLFRSLSGSTHGRHCRRSCDAGRAEEEHLGLDARRTSTHGQIDDSDRNKGYITASPARAVEGACQLRGRGVLFGILSNSGPRRRAVCVAAVAPANQSGPNFRHQRRENTAIGPRHTDEAADVKTRMLDAGCTATCETRARKGRIKTLTAASSAGVRVKSHHRRGRAKDLRPVPRGSLVRSLYQQSRLGW